MGKFPVEILLVVHVHVVIAQGTPVADLLIAAKAPLVLTDPAVLMPRLIQIVPELGPPCEIFEETNLSMSRRIDTIVFIIRISCSIKVQQRVARGRILLRSFNSTVLAVIVWIDARSRF